MSAELQRQAESLRAFVAAVEFVAEIERADLTVWDALAEALQRWIGSGAEVSGADSLRAVLGYILQITPEAGAPGGNAVGAVLDAAVTSWTARASRELNDGFPFLRRP